MFVVCTQAWRHACTNCSSIFNPTPPTYPPPPSPPLFRPTDPSISTCSRRCWPSSATVAEVVAVHSSTLPCLPLEATRTRTNPPRPITLSSRRPHSRRRSITRSAMSISASTRRTSLQQLRRGVRTIPTARAPCPWWRNRALRRTSSATMRLRRPRRRKRSPRRTNTPTRITTARTSIPTRASTARMTGGGIRSCSIVIIIISSSTIGTRGFEETQEAGIGRRLSAMCQRRETTLRSFTGGIKAPATSSVSSSRDNASIFPRRRARFRFRDRPAGAAQNRLPLLYTWKRKDPLR